MFYHQQFEIEFMTSRPNKAKMLKIWISVIVVETSKKGKTIYFSKQTKRDSGDGKSGKGRGGGGEVRKTSS